MGFVSTDDVIHSREELEKRQLKRLQNTIDLAQSISLYRKRLVDIGMVGEECVTGLNDLEDLPFTTEGELKITAPEIIPKIQDVLHEKSGFTFFCDAGFSHIREDEFIVEIIDPETATAKPDGEVGELVITTLCWKSVPLLRYKTGLSGSINSQSCCCDRSKRTISVK